VSSNVQGYFEELVEDAQNAILSLLGQRTLSQALAERSTYDQGIRLKKVASAIESFGNSSFGPAPHL